MFSILIRLTLFILLKGMSNLIICLHSILSFLISYPCNEDKIIKINDTIRINPERASVIREMKLEKDFMIKYNKIIIPINFA